MLKRLVVLLLSGLITLCGATGVLLGLVATDQLTPPQVTRQVGPLNGVGRRQQWALYGGVDGSLRVVHR
jgi:hypothetical protein